MITVYGNDDYFTIAGTSGTGSVSDFCTDDHSIWAVVSTNTGTTGPGNWDPRGILSSRGANFSDGVEFRWDDERFQYRTGSVPTGIETLAVNYPAPDNLNLQ